MEEKNGPREIRKEKQREEKEEREGERTRMARQRRYVEVTPLDSSHHCQCCRARMRLTTLPSHDLTI